MTCPEILRVRILILWPPFPRERRTLLVFTGIFTFLVDAYPLYAASALAANAFARCAFAGE